MEIAMIRFVIYFTFTQPPLAIGNQSQPNTANRLVLHATNTSIDNHIFADKFLRADRERAAQ